MPAQHAAEVIGWLGLKPHPEGGHYRELFRSAQAVRAEPSAADSTTAFAPDSGVRTAMTTVLFLLQRGERSAWHIVDADEAWCWHGGSPLELDIAQGARGDGPRTRHILGLDASAGHLPQAIVPANAWQAARSLGEWSLVSCIVAPSFEFRRFRMAPPEWTPPRAPSPS